MIQNGYQIILLSSTEEELTNSYIGARIIIDKYPAKKLAKLEVLIAILNTTQDVIPVRYHPL